ncbi:MAG: 50S ribosomal protein L10 [bacterium]
MPSAKKVRELAALSELVQGISGYYFIDFTGVPVNEFNQVRRQLRSAGARVRVVKNRLVLRALTDSGVGEQVAEFLKGPTSIVLAGEDAVVPARVLKEVAKRLPMLKVKGAYVDRAFFDADQFAQLAALPSKADLRGHLYAVLSAPIREFVMTLDGLMSEFGYVLEQLHERGAAVPSDDVPGPMPADPQEAGDA